ncbi:MAG: hypothetical protein K5866_04310 [Treponema sp.]|nr:hypothetical protein [Treponema sp.]
MLKKYFCFFITSFFMFCVFPEPAISGKSSSALAEEIYGKDLIEFCTSYKENEYTFIKVDDGKFLIIKSKKNSGSEYEVSLFAAVEEYPKDAARETVLELYKQFTPEGDAHCALFRTSFLMQTLYAFIVDGKLYCSFMNIMYDQTERGYKVEYFIGNEEDYGDTITKLNNLVGKWNLYQKKVQDQKDDDFLKSLGF